MQVIITILIKTITHFPPIFKYAVETFFIDFSRIVIKADGREKKHKLVQSDSSCSSSALAYFHYPNLSDGAIYCPLSQLT